MDNIQSVLDPDEITRTKPRYLKPQDIILFEHEFICKLPEINILSEKNVDILNDSIFKKADLKFFLSYKHYSGRLQFKRRLKRLALYLFPRYQIQKGLCIIDELCSNYFHWLTDALPRLIVADDFINGHEILLLEKYKNFSYVKQSLEILGYKAFYYKRNNSQLVHDIIVPSHTAPTGKRV